MTTQTLRIRLPVELLTVETLNKVKQIMKVDKQPKLYDKIVVVKFPNKKSLNQINILAIKLSAELNVDLFSIFQSKYEFTITYT